MLRDLLLGFIKIHALHHASRQPIYGLWMMEELARHGYTISPGTLYPTLHSLERAGYLVSEKRVVEGHRRRYYTITPAGEAALAEARERLAELVAEVLEEQT
ncbi:MAG TPA: helix-turn-helix transcriptional regulator [Thermoflexia bacterium]|nr:helix-turn-helix transcriptional regulator [Thermoflexia bacterium]